MSFQSPVQRTPCWHTAKPKQLVTNQSTTEQAGPGALLVADNAPTDQAVVDEPVLLAQALAGMTSRDEDSQLVLPLLGVQADILGLLLRGAARAADSTAALLCLKSKKRHQLYWEGTTGSQEKAATLDPAGEAQTSDTLLDWNETWNRPQTQWKDKPRPARKGPRDLSKAEAQGCCHCL